MLFTSLRHCLIACVMCIPTLVWADTLLLTIEVKDGQHRLAAAQTIDRNLSSPPRSTPDHSQLRVDARAKDGTIVYTVKMDNYWDAPGDALKHVPPPDSYVLRIPKGELVQSVRITSLASDRSSTPPATLLDVQKTPSGWK